jgi:hypothetical protein
MHANRQMIGVGHAMLSSYLTILQYKPVVTQMLPPNCHKPHQREEGGTLGEAHVSLCSCDPCCKRSALRLLVVQNYSPIFKFDDLSNKLID